ncbi:MAG: hypothetical protein WBB01_22300 [Phormidesmis sp.]
MSTVENSQLQALILKVEEIAPQLADFWQATAIIESLGYTDHIIEAEFGFPNALALGCYVYENHSPRPYFKPRQKPIQWKAKIAAEIKTFLAEFSRSFVYALPLLVMLVISYLPAAKDSTWLDPDLSALITLTTISSMIASGGFVQIISRRGRFYQQLEEPILARRVCLSLLKVGLVTNLALSLIGIWFGFYRNLFPDEYLIITNFYYLALSTLWMLFSILSVFFSWGTLLALLGLSSLFLILRLWLGLGAIESQLVAMGLTLLVISGIVLIDFRNHLAANRSSDQAGVSLPRLSAQVFILAPYFGYGIAYFSFIFLDRVIAGAALKPELGLLFAIDSEYQRSLDLALLVFLLLVPVVEYLSYLYIRYWYKSQKQGFLNQRRSRELQGLYRAMIGLLILLFCLLTTFVIYVLAPLSWGSLNLWQTLVGSFSYLLFSIGLLNSIVLFSLSLPLKVLKSVLPGLGANLVSGYILANLLDASFAVFGLSIGAAVFTLLSYLAVVDMIRQPDYGYYLGGY